MVVARISLTFSSFQPWRSPDTLPPLVCQHRSFSVPSLPMPYACGSTRRVNPSYLNSINRHFAMASASSGFLMSAPPGNGCVEASILPREGVGTFTFQEAFYG
jgi:hypothetical protein